MIYLVCDKEQCHLDTRCVLFFVKPNIDTASRVPLFERTLKTDLTALLSIRRRNYCGIIRCLNSTLFSYPQFL